SRFHPGEGLLDEFRFGVEPFADVGTGAEGVATATNDYDAGIAVLAAHTDLLGKVVPRTRGERVAFRAVANGQFGHRAVFPDPDQRLRPGGPGGHRTAPRSRSPARRPESRPSAPSTWSVCSPWPGGGVRTAAGLAESLIGEATVRTGPAGCGTSAISSRASTRGCSNAS